MTLAIVYSRAASGISAPLVTVEAHVSAGMAGFYIVGLPAAAVKESRDRIRSAFMNSQFEFPSRRIMINLAPADLPKEGARFDLPIALGILAASQQLPSEVLNQYEFIGELALSGELRPVKGVLPVVLSTIKAQRKLIVPVLNAEEAALVGKDMAFSAAHLLEVCKHLKGIKSLPPCVKSETFIPENITQDLADVRGQPHAKRALTVAAAGSHSLLLIGPPGTGKTMLASRITSILPPMEEEAALESAAIASVSNNGFHIKKWKQLPFRAPHHSSSAAALVGGGRPPKPGEISLAHHGVLFLDELPEFNRQVLECLREPLESQHITISRAAYQTTFPAKFQLLAAMNPCPCGFAGSANQCECNSEQIKRYVDKISGPLLDRIDMHVTVSRLKTHLLAKTSQQDALSSDSLRLEVIEARARQIKRQGKLNTELTVAELTDYANLTAEAESLLLQAIEKFNLSARAYHRLLKISLTLRDLKGEPSITPAHIGEALNFRCLDRSKAVYKLEI